MIGFTAVALIILCLVVSLCAFIQFSYGLYDINKMLMPASRAAAVCTSMEDAQKQAQLVAESESTDKNIENIKVSVEYADGYSKWESGTCIVVTVKAKIKTLDPYITTGEHGKKAVVTVENLDGLSGSNCQEQVFNYLKQNGFTDEAACGVLGNIEQESGFDSTKLQGKHVCDL